MLPEVMKKALLCHNRPVPQLFSGAKRHISKSKLSSF